MIPLLLSLLLFWMPSMGGLTSHTQWVVHQNSSLSVAGTSNIKDFTCRLESIDHRDTLAFSLVPTSKIIVFRQHTLAIPVDPFDCGNWMIRKDFLNTLKHDEYPFITLQFIDLRIENSPTWWEEPIQGAINIRLGGVSQRFVLDYDLHVYGKRVIELNGHKRVALSDFKLEAPERLGGLVKIDDQVDVNFRLVLHAVNRHSFTAQEG